MVVCRRRRLWPAHVHKGVRLSGQLLVDMLARFSTHRNRIGVRTMVPSKLCILFRIFVFISDRLPALVVYKQTFGSQRRRWWLLRGPEIKGGHARDTGSNSTHGSRSRGRRYPSRTLCWLCRLWMWCRGFGWRDARLTRRGLESRCIVCWSRLASLLRLLCRIAASLTDCHDEEFAGQCVSRVRKLDGTSRQRVARGESRTANAGMLDDGTEVLDRDDNVKLVLDFNIVEFVCLDCNRGLEWLFQDGYNLH